MLNKLAALKANRLIHLAFMSSAILYMPVANAESVLITGEIASLEKQIVSAPRTDRWQIQIQWMFEEGKIANKGDLIAVFDSGSIKSQIKQSEEQLSSEKLLLKKKELDLEQAVTDAESALAIAELEVEKARIEADITSTDVSKYDKGRYQIALERALLNKIKAEQALIVKKKEQEVEIAKQKISIIKIEERLAYQRQTLKRASVRAEITGQVTHMMHPWHGEKITAGTMLQQSMKAMLVQGKGGYQVQAWVHEIDVNKVKAGSAASLKLDAFPKQNFEGVVQSVASQSEQIANWSNSSYHRIYLKFKQQPNIELLPGMSVQVVVEGEADE
ncbi:HlyD family efflux transporter periplasmic adaptor subunit [Psychrosphaera sp.]|nr:HlyD family efflux transporter periplasmic adaptor subunit [Psychrosphaera sp.]